LELKKIWGLGILVDDVMMGVGFVFFLDNVIS